MTVLSDRELQALYPLSPHVCPASIDLHIGDTLMAWPPHIVRDPRIDQSGCWQAIPVAEDGAWWLRPGIRYLASTQENITIPVDMAGQIAARSSWGRDGLAVICGPAGVIDPGWSGRVTLELSVVGSRLVLWPGARVCQIVFHMLTSPAINPYRGKYAGDLTAVPSRLHLDSDVRQGVPA